MKLLCGGEKLSRALADRLLEGGGELWNMYGPTETTIWSSTVRILPDASPITVGLPIANTSFYVVDEAGHVLDPHVVRSSEPIFEAPTLRAVAKWRFEPGQVHGRPVRFRMAVPVAFAVMTAADVAMTNYYYVALGAADTTFVVNV